jgi:hypothetical protein
MGQTATISALLKTIIVAETDFEAASVFEYEPEIDLLVQDPAAMIIPASGENSRATTGENRREYVFSVRLLYERKSRGSAATETAMQAAVDSLVNAFDNDEYLSGNVQKIEPVDWQFGYINREKEFRIAELTVRVTKDFSLT